MGVFLEDIFISEDLIILYLKSRVVRLWYYDREEMIDFVKNINERYDNDVGIISRINVKNKHNKVVGHLKLVWSAYYKYVNGKCIESLISGGAENDTITLFDNENSEIICVKLSPFCDLCLFELLHKLLMNEKYIGRLDDYIEKKKTSI